MITKYPAGGEIEVQIQKAPFDTEIPLFFDEYATLDQREEDDAKDFTRYIIPENTTYSIIITLKKGLHFGELNDVWVTLNAEAKYTSLYNKTFSKVCIDTKLEKDFKITIDKTSEDLIVNEVLRRKRKEVFVAQTRTFMTNIAEYGAKRKTADSLGNKLGTNQESFNKNGISHKLRLSGGHKVPFTPPDTHNHFFAETEKLLGVRFKFHTRNFLEKSGMVKTPIPLESYSWDLLKANERQACFQKLQDYEKNQALLHPDQQNEALSESGVPLNVTEKWWKCTSRQRQEIFKVLQEQRQLKIQNRPRLGDVPEILAQSVNNKEHAPYPARIKQEVEKEKAPEGDIVMTSDDSNDENVSENGEEDMPLLLLKKRKTQPGAQSSASKKGKRETDEEGAMPKIQKKQTNIQAAKDNELEIELVEEARAISKDAELKGLKREAEEEDEEYRYIKRLAEIAKNRRERNERMRLLKSRKGETTSGV
ncbi:hypothetical protein PVAG01_00499 [Phlyctema vagabunda]|uniref:Uncharacterized protein n=1 Tax=Phlyctema vagabunda TaxID=108571 RepID=A0ABR4PUF8_9HELO